MVSDFTKRSAEALLSLKKVKRHRRRAVADAVVAQFRKLSDLHAFLQFIRVGDEFLCRDIHEECERFGIALMFQVDTGIIRLAGIELILVILFEEGWIGRIAQSKLACQLSGKK